jgi:hypothetical protein
MFDVYAHSGLIRYGGHDHLEEDPLRKADVTSMGSSHTHKTVTLHKMLASRSRPAARFGHTFTPLELSRPNDYAAPATSAVMLFGKGEDRMCSHIWLLSVDSDPKARKPFTFNKATVESQLRPCLRYFHAACRLSDGSILVTGGKDKSDYTLHDAWKLQRGSNNKWLWTPLNCTIPQIHLRRCRHTMTLIGNVVYILGGGLPSCVTFNVDTNQWNVHSIKSSLDYFDLRGHSAVRHGRSVLLMGVADEHDRLSYSQCVCYCWSAH